MANIVETVRYYAYVWVALAKLHYDNPTRKSFTNHEIHAQMKNLWPDLEERPIFRQLLYQHMVASRQPNGMPLRLIHKMDDGTNRLYLPGDPIHPARVNGRTTPDEVPAGFDYLVDWYRTSYVRHKQTTASETGNVGTPQAVDPILALWKKGDKVWANLGGTDAFVKRVRSGWDGTDAA